MDDMDDDFIGEVKPLYGRWVWPMKQMEPGQWFTVAHHHRNPEEVRNMVSVRAAQLGKRFSVNRSWKPGITRVECVPNERQAKPMAVLDFEAVTGLLSQLYGVDAGSLAWQALNPRQEQRVEAELQGDLVQAVHMVDMPPDFRFAIDCGHNGFTITRVDRGTSVESWTKRQLADIMG